MAAQDNGKDDNKDDPNARAKRAIGIVIIGCLVLAVFYYMINGVVDVLLADSVVERDDPAVETVN